VPQFNIQHHHCPGHDFTPSFSLAVEVAEGGDIFAHLDAVIDNLILYLDGIESRQHDLIDSGFKEKAPKLTRYFKIDSPKKK
jgi:hypothetical protein